MKNILIAIDIALNKSGLAIVNLEDETLVSTRVIEVKNHWDYYRKLSHLYSAYNQIFETLLSDKTESGILVLEGRLKAGWSASAMASIEGARVCAYLSYAHTCEKLGIKVESHVYDPNLVKHFIAHKRSAKKDEMYEKALSRFSWLSRLEYQEDEFDAIYLALYHMFGEKNEHSKRNKKARKV